VEEWPDQGFRGSNRVFTASLYGVLSLVTRALRPRDARGLGNHVFVLSEGWLGARAGPAAEEMGRFPWTNVCSSPGVFARKVVPKGARGFLVSLGIWMKLVSRARISTLSHLATLLNFPRLCSASCTLYGTFVDECRRAWRGIGFLEGRRTCLWSLDKSHFKLLRACLSILSPCTIATTAKQASAGRPVLVRRSFFLKLLV